VSVARDLKLARVAKKHGAKSALRTLWECRRNDIPYSWGLAMVEQESRWENIFGCDHGPGKAFCHQKVTNAKVRSLLNSGLANGVGYTQLTSPSYVREAMAKRGGAASTKNQIIVGMKVLRQKTGGDMSQAWKYNGSPEYQNQIEKRANRWHQRFKAAGLT
jgi:hypothetical protein